MNLTDNFNQGRRSATIKNHVLKSDVLDFVEFACVLHQFSTNHRQQDSYCNDNISLVKEDKGKIRMPFLI